MCLEEHAVRTRGHRRSRQDRSELALAARSVAAATGQLNRMRRVKENGEAKPAQYRDRPHVRDQVIVAEGRAAFGDEEFFSTDLLRLPDHLAHFCRRQKLTLLQIDDFAGQHSGLNQVGLPAKECGNLQNVHCFTGDGGLSFRMHIGQHPHTQVCPNPAQHFQPFVEPRPAK